MTTKITPQKSRPTSSLLLFWAVAVAATCLFATPVLAVNGTWNATTTPASWGVAGNWSGSAVAGGAGSNVTIAKGMAPYSLIVTLDGDRTVGIMNLGGSSHYTVASGTGGSLFFDNGGSNAQLNFLSNSTYSRTVSAPILLNSSLDINSSGPSGVNRILSGNITASGTNNTARVITNSANVGGATLQITGNVSDGAGARVISTHQNIAGSVMTLSGSNTFTGGVRVTAGALLLTNSGAASERALGAGTLTLDGGSLNFNGYSSANYGNNTVISANTTIDLTFNASAGDTLTLGALSVGNHVVTVQNTASASNSGKDALIFGVTTLTGNTTFAVNSGTLPMLLSLGALNGSSNLTKTGSGEMELNSAAGSYSGTTTLNAGSLAVGHATALGSGSLIVNGGLLNVGTTSSIVGAMTINSGTVSNAVGGQLSSSAGFTVTGGAINAILAGSGGLVKSGTGTATLGTAVGGANTYTGGTIINAGSLALGASNRLPTARALTVNGGSFDLGTFNQTVAAVTVAGGAITSTSGTLTATSYAVQSGSASAILGGAATLAKTTSGTATLSRVNTYTGATTVSVGTLIIAGAGSINSSSGVTINGGTLAYNSSTNLTAGLTFTSGKIGGTNWAGSLNNLTIGSGQTISPGNSPGTAATGNQTWAGSGSYVWEINNATGTAGADPGWDLLTGTGALTLTATSGNKFNINVTSLTLGNAAGDAVNFNSASTYQWKIADFASTISSFDASAFNIDTSAFSNATAGAFSIARGETIGGGDNTELYLVYSAIPEPTTWGLLGLSLIMLVTFRRRRLA